MHQIALVGVGKIARDQHILAIADSPSFTIAATASRMVKEKRKALRRTPALSFHDGEGDLASVGGLGELPPRRRLGGGVEGERPIADDCVSLERPCELVQHRVEAADELEHAGDPGGFGLRQAHERRTQRPVPCPGRLGVVHERAGRLGIDRGRTEVPLGQESPGRLCSLHVRRLGAGDQPGCFT